jgi:hypothetical protein
MRWANSSSNEEEETEEVVMVHAGLTNDGNVGAVVSLFHSRKRKSPLRCLRDVLPLTIIMKRKSRTPRSVRKNKKMSRNGNGDWKRMMMKNKRMLPPLPQA